MVHCALFFLKEGDRIYSYEEQIFDFFFEFVNLKIIANIKRQLHKEIKLDIIKPLSIKGIYSFLKGINSNTRANPRMSQGNKGKKANILSLK